MIHRNIRKHKSKVDLQFQVQEPMELNELRMRNRPYQCINPNNARLGNFYNRNEGISMSAPLSPVESSAEDMDMDEGRTITDRVMLRLQGLEPRRRFSLDGQEYILSDEDFNAKLCSGAFAQEKGVPKTPSSST